MSNVRPHDNGDRLEATAMTQSEREIHAPVGNERALLAAYSVYAKATTPLTISE